MFSSFETNPVKLKVIHLNDTDKFAESKTIFDHSVKSFYILFLRPLGPEYFQTGRPRILLSPHEIPLSPCSFIITTHIIKAFFSLLKIRLNEIILLIRLACAVIRSQWGNKTL